MLEATDAPTLRYLLDSGTYRRALSTFPSLTPVCLASVATGGHPEVHGIPHLVWWHRAEQRLVEYGSSFGALVAAGPAGGILDTIVHLHRPDPVPTGVARLAGLRAAGAAAAAVNTATLRGRS